MSANSNFRILSLDGGGIRGLITAIVLERLEEKLKKHDASKGIIDYFDVIAGTSTGSIIACALAKGYNAAKIKNLYLSTAYKIFPQSKIVINDLLNRVGLGRPLFDGEGLEMVLKTEFDGLSFGDLAKPVLVVSYDTYNRQAVVFKSTKNEHKNLPIWEICRSSAAAPVAFPGYEMRNVDFIQDWRQNGYRIPDSGGIPLIDGGVVANDPALCAIAERLRWNTQGPSNPKWAALGEEKVKLEDIVVASFGTGRNVKSIGVKEVKEWGRAEWLNFNKGLPLIDVFSDGADDAVCYIIQQIIDREFFRFQPQLEQDISSFIAKEENIRAMEENAQKFLNTPEIDQRLDQLIQKLI